MFKIDWKARIKNKQFWIGITPLIIILITQILGLFGVKIDLEWLSDQLLAIITTVFMILGIIGVVTDTSTPTSNDLKYQNLED